VGKKSEKSESRESPEVGKLRAVFVCLLNPRLGALACNFSRQGAKARLIEGFYECFTLIHFPTFGLSRLSDFSDFPPQLLPLQKF